MYSILVVNGHVCYVAEAALSRGRGHWTPPDTKALARARRKAEGARVQFFNQGFADARKDEAYTWMQ